MLEDGKKIRKKTHFLQQLFRCWIQDSAALMRSGVKMKRTRGEFSACLAVLVPQIFYVPACLCVCLRACACVCACVCTRAHTYGRRAGLEERIHFTLEEALWLAQTICCFILYSVACLSAKTTNNVGRTRYKRRKVQKHWASSESTQLTTAISQVSSHWFISRCKLVGLDRFSVVGDACSPCVASLKWGQLLLSPV